MEHFYLWHLYNRAVALNDTELARPVAGFFIAFERVYEMRFQHKHAWAQRAKGAVRTFLHVEHISPYMSPRVVTAHYVEASL